MNGILLLPFQHPGRIAPRHFQGLQTNHRTSYDHYNKETHQYIACLKRAIIGKFYEDDPLKE